MKIAIISFEYPPDTAVGGIATYCFQTARMLSARGHHVEVFAGSPHRDGTEDDDGVLIHRIRETDLRQFGMAAGPLFAARHAAMPFDVLEGPEYHADARAAVRLVPDIPLVIKLHTPSTFLLKLNYHEPSFAGRVRLYLGALASGVKPHWGYDTDGAGYRDYVLAVDEDERALAHAADEIVSPSQSLGRQLIEQWQLDPARVVTIPYTFVPPAELLRIPADTRTNRVTFLGRLEARKGVLELARAIPAVLRRFPDATFRIVGDAAESPRPGIDMRRYLEQQLRSHRAAVEFAGPVTYDRIPATLADTDICVFPSRWENFPFVCLESMAAARGIVASSAGGMADMLDAGRAGRLVPPRRPSRMAAAIIELLADPALRIELGRAARLRILEEYNADRVGTLREASYARAVARRHRLGARLHRASQ